MASALNKQDGTENAVRGMSALADPGQREFDVASKAAGNQFPSAYWANWPIVITLRVGIESGPHAWMLEKTGQLQYMDFLISNVLLFP